MIEIKPMDENYLHLRCLHRGPVDTTMLKPPLDTLPGGHPPHPWSDDVLRDVAERYRANNVGHPRPAAFMREMIRRYETCAILAWDESMVVGHLRFYPMRIARLFTEDDPCPKMMDWACEPEEDEGTLWVQCVMTCRPYNRSENESRARKGVGLKLAQYLIGWAQEHNWKRIVKVAHADIDCFYGQMGGGGKAFWEKAGFKVVKSIRERPDWPAEFMALAESQGREKGMSPEEVWTWSRMRYDL